MSDLIDELLASSKQNSVLGNITFCGAYGLKKFELDVDENLSKVIKKAPGHYVTLKFSQNFLWSTKIRKYLSKQVEKSIKNFTQKLNIKKVLVVGLGNENMTCDSLGKLVTQELVVLDDELVSQFSSLKVCILNPGVEGVTGINSFDLIKSAVNCLKPNLLVAIDSLTANDISRLGFSVQLSDSGINPGGGVGKKQHVLNQETLGVPVLSIGVPLLISIENLTDNVQTNSFYRHFTPKEIDYVVEKCARIISSALNSSFYLPQVLNNF